MILLRQAELYCSMIYYAILYYVIGITTPTIVGVDWRIDYAIRSNSIGRINAPMFFVSLKIHDRGLYRYITMTATNEELQDLLSKVKDAVKQADRGVSSSSDML